MPRLSWCENVSPGTFEKQAQGSKPDRFDLGTSALTMRTSGLHYMKTFLFNEIRVRNNGLFI